MSAVLDVSIKADSPSEATQRAAAELARRLNLPLETLPAKPNAFTNESLHLARSDERLELREARTRPGRAANSERVTTKKQPPGNTRRFE